MPEGKLRSGVYRSFIMCDDPRGVVDCGAIKKQSKSHSNSRFDHPLKPKERSEMARKKKSTEEEPSSSSLHLSRVSKGIRKLNTAVDSWSNEAVRPEDIAKDLLRGALDLEESLAMLCSIQEDGNNNIKSISKDRRAHSRFQRSMSDRFGERIERRQENVVATRDCYEELRKVIRESFLRQNLLPQTTTGMTKTTRSDFASSSSSSSQSSMVSGSTKSSSSSDIPRRAPSLIARLMGLDVSPQEPATSTANHIEKQNVSMMKKKKEEVIPGIVRRNSSRAATLQSLPVEIPSEIVGNKRPVLRGKLRMQGEVHPRMINQRKDPQAMGAYKTGSNKLILPSSRNKKDREPKEESEGKVIETITGERKAKDIEKHILAKKENIGEGKDRYRPHELAVKPLNNNPASQKKPNNISDMSRSKSRPSRLSSSSRSSNEPKREKKSSEAKRKIRTSGSSQGVRGSLNQLSSDETTSSEINNIQGDGDNKGEVTSCGATIQHSREQETSQISLESFLSNSTEFHNYAEDLFDLEADTRRSRESSAFRYSDRVLISDQRLALAFAKEVATRRSLLLIAEPTRLLRSSVDFEELVIKVCDEFDSMRRYRDTSLGVNSFVKENVQGLLEEDLKSKEREMGSGVWDLGWRSEFQINETVQAVVDLEKLILSGLIHEILS